jgi:selenium metabolism protein YedF
MEHLDLKGKTCPIPVIETKKFLETGDVADIEVLVDNDTACENVSRFLKSQGFEVVSEVKGADFCIKGIRVATKTAEEPSHSGKLLVFVNSEALGHGSDELGRILMRSFLNTLKELDEKPWRILLINSGVKLVAEGSECLTPLKELHGLDVEILSCGTCLDYFQLKDKVMVGKVTNMYEIVSSFTRATKVISP